MFYKLISEQSIIGVITQNDFRKYQPKHNAILFSDVDHAQYAEYKGVLYRDNWLKAVTTNSVEYIDVSIVSIESDEYELLAEGLEINDEIEVQEEPEEVIEEAIEDEEPTLEYIRDAKIAQMSRTCNQIIENGFDVELSDNQTHHFSLTLADQMNISTLSAEVDAGLQFIPYHADGELCKYFSVEDVMLIINGAINHKTFNVTWFNSLKAYINSLQTINDIVAITYNTQIPVEYQSEVLRVLLGANNE